MLTFIKKSLKQRLIISFFLVSLIPILILLFLTFYRDKNNLISTRIDRLKSIAALNATKIELFFNKQKGDIAVAQDYYNIKTNLPVLSKYRNERSNNEYIKAKAMLDRQLKTFQNVYSYKDIKLINKEGLIVYCSDDEHALFEIDTLLSDPYGRAFVNGKKDIFISDVCRSIIHKNKFIIFVTAPAYDFDNKFIGVIVFEIMMDSIHDSIHDDTGGHTGETLIAKQYSDEIVFLNPLRYDKDATLKKKVRVGSNISIPMQEAVHGNDGSGIYLDYRGVKVVAAWKHISSPAWGLVTKMDLVDVFKDFKSFWIKLIWKALLLFAFVSFIAYFIAKQISNPIIKLTESTELIANGDLTKRIDIDAKDEIGLLATSFNKMSENLQFRDKKLKQQQEELANKSKETLDTNKKLLEEVKEKKETGDVIKRHQNSLIILAGYGYSSESLLYDFIKNIASAIDVQYVSVWKLVDNDKRLRCLDHYNKADKSRSSGTELFQKELPTYFTAIKKEKIISVNNVLTDPILCEMVELYLKPKGTKALLDIPFSVLGEKNGVLRLEHVGETRKWYRYEQSFAVAAAEMLSLKFEQVRRKKVEDELIMRNNAIEQSADMILITDSEGVIEYVNPAVQKSTLYSPEEMIGNKISLLKSGKHDRTFYKNMWNTIKEGKIWQGRLINRKKNGVLYDENMTISPVKDKNSIVTHFVSIKHDISELIKKENELNQAKEFAEHTAENIKKTLKESEELRSIAEKAKEQALKFARQAKDANKSKSEFLANMSHELRTPLNGIIGLTEIMFNTSLTEEQEKNLKLVLYSGNSLLSLVNDILDLSKIEEGKISIGKYEFNLRESIENIAEQQAFSAHQKRLEFIVNIKNDIPENVIGDAKRVTEVLVNLIGNAIKFTHKGEILLEAELAETDVNTKTVHFHVKDSGIGISQEMQSKIFERFTQADSSTLRKYGGAGLGITISKSLVELMGGKIWIKSKLNKGSDFHFTIKFDLPKNRKDVKFILDEKVRGLTILISLFNKTSMKLLSSLLKSWDCKVIAADNIDQIRQSLIESRKNNSPVNFLLVDSPNEKLHLIKNIKVIPELKDSKIIYLTSKLSGDTSQTIEAGAYKVLLKPVKKLELLNALTTINKGNTMQKEKRQSEITRDMKESKLKIIMAEDNMVNQEVVKSALKNLGHQCTIVENGREVIARWKEGGYDIIFMDVHMPEMDGLEATETIRNLEENFKSDKTMSNYKRVPIVAMTACAMDGDKEKCLAVGMDDYII